jgi:geranylgeranyl transferase type-2 subunit alpha
VVEKQYTPELLQKTAELLKKNPEYYTIWNHRRRIFVQEFHNLEQAVVSKEKTEEQRISEVLDILQMDLQFLFPLLLKFPKCYWIWNHRLWLLEQSTILLQASQARKLWEEELSLVGKMLSRDNRNFHGWGYRRMVVRSLESAALQGRSLSRQEFEYTKKMIGINLSNFSAWHNRTKVILKILDEENATDQERQIMLDEGLRLSTLQLNGGVLIVAELELIHKALFDPYDQSLWFYHQNLMCTFDPDTAPSTMAPRLSVEQRLEYVATEREYIEEVLEDSLDCKWAYQALIESTMIEGKLRNGLSDDDKGKIRAWLQKLKELDTLRAGRWTDLERSLG